MDLLFLVDQSASAEPLCGDLAAELGLSNEPEQTHLGAKGKGKHLKF